jgi:hypothetical protein
MFTNMTHTHTHTHTHTSHKLTAYSTPRRHSRTPLIWIKWDGKPSGYAGNTENWIFLRKEATFAV